MKNLVALSEIATSLPCHYGEECTDGVEGTPVAKVSNISSGGEFHRDFEYRSFSDRQLRGLLVQEGELLVVKSSGSKANILSGKTAYCDKSFAGKLVASNFLIRLRVDPSRADSRYLWHVLNSDVSKAFVRRVVGTTTYPNLKWSTYSAHPIPLPPLEEQRRIAAILDKASALKKLAYRQQIAVAEAETYLFLDSLGSPFPRLTKWPVVRLSQLGLLERGVSKHRPRNDPTLMNGPYPFIQTGDVAGCHRVIETFNSTYSEKGLAQSRLWPEGTLCITIAANIAKTGILGFEACFPDSVVGFQSDNQALITYVQCWMGFLQKHIEKMAPESAQKNINLEILRELQIPLPHEEALKKFHEQMLSLRGLWAKQRSRHDRVGELNCALSSLLLCKP